MYDVTVFSLAILFVFATDSSVTRVVVVVVVVVVIFVVVVFVCPFVCLSVSPFDF